MRLRCEQLEDRCTPTTAVLANGVLALTGTVAADRIVVRQVSGLVRVGGIGDFTATDVQSIVVDAGAGNDLIDLRRVLIPTTLDGGAGRDIIWGGNGPDVIHGGSGNDRLLAGGGLDSLFGDDGNDFLDDGSRGRHEPADGGGGRDTNADVWVVGGYGRADVNQWGSPTCSFLAVVSGLVGKGWRPGIRYVGPSAQGLPRYLVSYAAGPRLVAYDGTTTSADAVSNTEGESWVTLLEAWRWYDRAATQGIADPPEAFLTLTGRSMASTYAPANLGWIAQSLAQGKVVVACTQFNTSYLVAHHAYLVVGLSGGQVLVRNPWGVDGARPWVNPDDGLVLVPWAQFQFAVYAVSSGW